MGIWPILLDGPLIAFFEGGTDKKHEQNAVLLPPFLTATQKPKSLPSPSSMK